MIWDSQPWREELLRIAARLKWRYQQKRWTEQSHFLLEKELFIGSFAARKLIESNKVSSKLLSQSVQVTSYPAGPKEITLLNQHRFQGLYDLHAGKAVSLTYEKVANQFIHSSIFAPFAPLGGGLVGHFVASDRTKKKFLYYISNKVVIEFFSSIGSDSPQRVTAKFDNSKKEYVVETF